MRVWITKYALTQGVLQMDGFMQSKSCPTMITNKKWVCETYHKPFWYDNQYDAVAHAETMRQIKLESLKKQIDKISKLKIKIEKNSMK